ncbi:flagellar basal body-associated FliL family protein [Aestuariirhabdus litorea]|nr:flagellar basal body-associated FliL family protein [Aestuariirhabdus litorea]
MAKDDQEETQDVAEEQAAGSKKKLILFLVLSIVLLAGVGGGTTYFLLVDSDDSEQLEGGEESSAGSTLAEAHYLELTEPFIVDFNVEGKQRFLQLYITVMARDTEVLDVLETHMPLVRNNLNLLIGRQEFEGLSTSEGKQKLKDEALTSVQELVKAETGDDAVEAILFTNFVIQ